MNFPGVVMSRTRLRTPFVDGGDLIKRDRVGVQRGFADIPHNASMRGLARRQDKSRLP